jgi:hypothetical protein
MARFVFGGARRRTPSATSALVELCGRGVVEIRSLASQCRRGADPACRGDGGEGCDCLDRIVLISNVCDGLLGAFRSRWFRERSARKSLVWRWGSADVVSRRWMTEVLTAANPEYRRLVNSIERSSSRLHAGPAAPWVSGLGIDESDPEDWKRAIYGGEGERLAGRDSSDGS